MLSLPFSRWSSHKIYLGPDLEPTVFPNCSKGHLSSPQIYSNHSYTSTITWNIFSISNLSGSPAKGGNARITLWSGCLCLRDINAKIQLAATPWTPQIADFSNGHTYGVPVEKVRLFHPPGMLGRARFLRALARSLCRISHSSCVF